ncbi:MAG: AAA family ATPase [Oscillospiraceae bacterium]|nr:AAA family ATPase [Oscillospiraceae bacterium]
MTESKKFDFYTLPSLTDAERTPPEFIVDGMIPVGLSFLAGAPKIRKSFLALQLAAAVAGGAVFLGRTTRKCGVVYLDLEGSKSRISTRAGAMGIPLPDNLLIANNTPSKLAGTLTADLRELHRERPTIRLIIIDTYSRARGVAKSYGANAYDADVGLLEPIQRMASDENIAVLFVHHERKGAAFAADSFERLSGTMGISGSADAVLNLVADGKRADGRATLEYNPRDAIGGELNLIFDNASCKWVLSDFQNGQMLDEPVIRWIIQNAPDKAQTRFSDYHAAYYEIYRHQSDRPADAIRNAVEKYQQLFAAHGIAVQLGAKSNDKRGIRIVKV